MLVSPPDHHVHHATINMLTALPDDVPRGKSAILTNSGFFTPRDHDENEHPASRRALPTPAAVREECIRQHGSRARNLNRPPPVRFPALGLFVKFGYLVSEAEAQCLILVRKYLPTVPVPEVYGWLHDGRQCFIYVELLEGETLEDCWDDLSSDDKRIVCEQLRGFVATWRRLPQTLFASESFIGNVAGGSLLDWIFVNSCAPEEEPFASVSEFHDFYTTAYGPARLDEWRGRSPHPFRDKLLDDVPIVFTHADLHPSNIMLAPRRSWSGTPEEGNKQKDEQEIGPGPRVIGIIDWQQSGWYPAYWEYNKARWAWSKKAGETWWRTHLPLIMETAKFEGECWDYWDYFTSARGM
ncbi:hypothetical protein SCUCBS95973_006548 [Sporothrix curviconia]|uniref:Aminoglycoside phosphotransferase domain-containing protein n=1 Tax=Sporothrix curviconia TaxID=1260050 RepID=A0ABP0C630_9PEZI